MAGTRILSISLIDGVYHYVEIDRRGGVFFSQQPRTTNSVEALMTLCRSAREIHLAMAFPTEAVTYQRILLPKVARKHLPSLVRQDATEKFELAEPVAARFKVVKEVMDAGISKWQTVYCAVLAKHLLAFWNTFKSYRKKIRFVSPLPIAVASLVAQLAAPEENFMVIWVGEDTTLIIIGSPQGTVYVARSVPLTLSRKRLELKPAPPLAAAASDASIEIELNMEACRLDTGEAADAPPAWKVPASVLPTDAPSSDGPDPHDDMVIAGTFARELERALGVTSTFFKQEFREQAPRRLFLLGNPNLKLIHEFYPLPAAYDQVAYELTTSAYRGLSPRLAAENIHVTANLFIREDFNFIPEQELNIRKSNLLVNTTALLLLTGLGLSMFWTIQLHQKRADTLQAYRQQTIRLHEAQSEEAHWQAEVNRLKPIEGWKQFYDDTVSTKPPWNMFISELAILMEDYVLISSFQVQSGDGDAHNCRLQGKIRADNWEAGLRLFREFGRNVQSSPMFDVLTIQYAPEGLNTDPSKFDFEMALTLTRPGGIL